MISRSELERLIVVGLRELRQAEQDLARRFRRTASRRRIDWVFFAGSLADLKAKAARLEELLGALDGDRSGGHPAAA